MYWLGGIKFFAFTALSGGFHQKSCITSLSTVLYSFLPPFSTPFSSFLGRVAMLNKTRVIVFLYL